MSERIAFVITLALTPFAVFAFRLVSRYIVEVMYRLAPEGWFKRLLARDRASRARRPQ